MMRVWRHVGTVLYWLALPLIAPYLWISRPRTRVLLMHKNSVLLVQNWLGTGKWAVPGGGIHKHEQPIDAAVREIYEELQIRIDPGDLSYLGMHESVESGFLRGKYHLYVVELPHKPVFRTRRQEINTASWHEVNGATSSVDHMSATARDSLSTWFKRSNLV